MWYLLERNASRQLFVGQSINRNGHFYFEVSAATVAIYDALFTAFRCLSAERIRDAIDSRLSCTRGVHFGYTSGAFSSIPQPSWLKRRCCSNLYVRDEAIGSSRSSVLCEEDPRIEHTLRHVREAIVEAAEAEEIQFFECRLAVDLRIGE